MEGTQWIFSRKGDHMTFQSIQVQDLTKKFGRKTVIDNANFNIAAGEICAVIGKNGAGKTTLFKLLTEQLFPNKGHIEFQGSFERPSIGTLIENPVFFPKFSAYHNLAYFSKQITGSIDKERIQEILELVELENSRRKFEQFSLGMKQRLGIALALLFKPDLLVLDEPSNGLDPEGVRDIRQILLKVNRERRTTIIVSSHVLTELEEIATDYIILNEGQIVEKVSKDKLIDNMVKTLVIKVDAAKQAATVLNEQFDALDIKIVDDTTLHLSSDDIPSYDINRRLVSKGIQVHSLTIQNETLEDYFFEKVGV